MSCGNSSAPPPGLPHRGGGNVFPPPLVGGVRGGGGTDTKLEIKQKSSYEKTITHIAYWGYLCGVFGLHKFFYLLKTHTPRYGLFPNGGRIRTTGQAG